MWCALLSVLWCYVVCSVVRVVCVAVFCPACHELRNPLHGITAIIRFFEDDTSLSREHRDDLQSLKGLATSMQRLINDVLDLAKLSDGTLLLAVEQVHYMPCTT